MPKVPTAEGFGALPGIRQGQARPVLSMEEASLPGQRMIRAGQAAMQVGGQMAEFAIREQEKINKARLNDAYNQADRLTQDLRVKMKQLQGADAVEINGVPLDQYFGEELNKGLSAITQNLQAPVVREQFSLLADDVSTRFRNEAITHMAEQGQVYESRVLDDTVTTSMNLIAENAGNTFVERWNLTRAKDALRTKYDRAGFDPEQADLRMKEDLGKSHTVIIEAMVNRGQVMQAKSYFDRHRGDFLSADASTVEGALQKSISASQALVDADAIFAKIRLTDDAIPRVDLENEARKIAGNDATRLSALRQEINTRIGFHLDQYAGEYANDQDRVFTLAQQSPAAAMASPSFARLKAKDQKAILDMATGIQSDRVRAQQDVTYGNLAYGDPRMLAGMTDNAFRSLRFGMSQEQFARLDKRRQELRQNPLAVDRMNVDNATFDFLLGELGIDDKKQVEPATLFRLRDTMESALTLARLRLGREYLTPDEMRSVVTGEWAMNQGAVFTQQPAQEAPASGSFVRVPSPAGFVNIPQDDYSSIAAELARRGYAAVPDMIISMYNSRKGAP